MSYSGFRFTGRGAQLSRPADRPPAVEGDAWASDRVGGVGGTEIDATWINRLKANLEHFVVRLAGNLHAGDTQLADAIQGALEKKADQADIDALLEEVLTEAAIADDLLTNDPARPLSAKQGVALKALIHGLGDIKVVANLAAAAALVDLSNGDVVHVLDNVDGKWGRYQITAAGDGTWTDAAKVLTWTQDQAPASHGHTVADLLDASPNGRTLLQAADFAAMQGVLGLGTAATRNVGTAAGNVPVLDGSGRLPAVDGSQLTNLPTPEAGDVSGPRASGVRHIAVYGDASGSLLADPHVEIIPGAVARLDDSNVVTQPWDLTASPWQAVDCTRTAGPTAPDGDTAWTHIGENAVTGTHRVQLAFTTQTPNGVPYWFVECVKASARTLGRVAILSGNNAEWTDVVVDLGTGAVVNVQGQNPQYRVWPGPDGSWIVAVRGVASSTGSKYIMTAPRLADTFSTYLGDGASGILAWGAQIQVGVDQPRSLWRRVIDLSGDDLEGGDHVPSSRQISTAGLASGGGALTVDRTISVPAATPVALRAGSANNAALTPYALTIAGNVVTLTPAGGSVQIDMDAGFNFTFNVTSNTVMGNPTNVKSGRSGAIFVWTNGSALSFNSSWKFAGGAAPTLTSGWNLLVYSALGETFIACSHLGELA